MVNHELGSFLKKARQEGGLTQSELASEAGMSLAILQRIEAGEGNPSWQTLCHLLEPLGVELTFSHRPAPWDTLADCGVPLLKLGDRTVLPSPELLVQSMRSAIRELSATIARNSGSGLERERKLEAVSALLWAVQLHYPRFYKRHFKGESFARFLPRKPTGRLIKLKRQALTRLATYL